LYYSQDFSKAFITQYLVRYLAEPVKLRVECIDHNRSFRVQMKMGRGASSKRAVITTGWVKAMETYSMKKMTLSCSYSSTLITWNSSCVGLILDF
jgi:hypothetical protein